MTFSIKLYLIIHLICYLSGAPSPLPLPLAESDQNILIEADASFDSTVSPNNNSDLKATYLLKGPTFYPIVTFQNGQNLIDYYQKNTVERKWDYDIARDMKPFEDELSDDTFYYYALPPDGHRKTLTFSDIQSKQSVPASAPANPKQYFPAIATNNPSHDFWPDVNYHYYQIDEQNHVPQIYIDHIQQKLLADGLSNTPVVISETWELDFDNDDHDEAFIIATNRLSYEQSFEGWAETAAPSQLAAENGLGYYSYVTLYSQTFAPMEFETSIEPIYDRFFPDASKPYRKPEPLYQFALNDTLQLFSVWTDDKSSDMIQPFTGPVICDLNDDGLYDFFTIPGGIYAPCDLYLQNADGEFIFIGGFSMSA